MPDNPDDPLYPAELRSLAESLMQHGRATASDGHFCGVDALSVLYKMACSPDNAADSLKMLHELQTLQIELDLQREQYESNANDAESELKRYKALFDFAPVAYVIINRDGNVVEGNQAATILFGAASIELEGQRLEDFLAPDSRAQFNWLFGKVVKGSAGEACMLQLKDAGSRGFLRVYSALASDGDVVFMTMSKSQDGVPGS